MDNQFQSKVEQWVAKAVAGILAEEIVPLKDRVTEATNKIDKVNTDLEDLNNKLALSKIENMPHVEVEVCEMGIQIET